MDLFFTLMTAVLVTIIILPFYRVVRGPTVFDRLLALGAMGGKTIGLICLIGILSGRLDMFVDVALAYAILNFIGGIVVARCFQPEDNPEEHR
jgi:multicomponent Na+:H+ antiporter subunit F